MSSLTNVKGKVIIISTLFSSSMIIYSLLPRYFVIGLSVLFLIVIGLILKKQYEIKESLFVLSICFLPTSFVSVLGTSTSQFPFSWFHILTILLFLICTLEKLNQKYFLLLMLFLSFGCVRSFMVPQFSDAIKQVLTIVLFLVSFIIGSSFACDNHGMFKEFSADILLSSCFSLGLQVIIQRGMVRTRGIDVGHHIVMGQGRVAYGGIMGDYSFATLYLAIGCVLTLVYFLDYKRISAISFIFLELFLLFSILCVTSRTGLVAFAAIVLLYLIRHINRLNKRIVFLILSGCLIVPIVLSRLVSARGNQSLIDSSGRLDNYLRALSHFKDSPLCGVGFGLNNLYAATGLGVPHNFFVQYLLQIGIVGTAIIVAFFVVYLGNHYQKGDPLKWLFWLVAIGAMFIPDITSSRYFGVVIIITMIGEKQNHENEASRKNSVQNEKSIYAWEIQKG